MSSADSGADSVRSHPSALSEEGNRLLRICNACRYCEGFCAVFPALERRFSFTEQDVNYLANLCHDCGECYYSCQYAPPHEFALNLPRTLAAIRKDTYQKYAWPGVFAGLFRRTGLALALSAVVIPALFVLLTILFTEPSVFFSPHTVAEGSFYRVISHTVMTASFGIVGLFVLAALGMGLRNFWRESGEPWSAFLNPRVLGQACSEALRLRYLDGGGDGCAYPGDLPSQARRWFHHLTFYGFLLTFAATTVAAFYHNVLGVEAPYPFLSAPVILGTAGGVGLLIGPIGLLWLKRSRNQELSDSGQSGLDVTFLALLLLISLTGFLLLVFRETSAMGILLAAHLGLVLGLFVTMPYGKFVHGIYRFAALARNEVEKRRE
jgi:citrate/tricarballylate utilization protein